MSHASYQGVATKLRNALIAVEGYESMFADGASIPLDDMVLTMGEITFAADQLNDLIYSEAVSSKEKEEAVHRELDRCRVGCKDLGGKC